MTKLKNNIIRKYGFENWRTILVFKIAHALGHQSAPAAVPERNDTRGARNYSGRIGLYPMMNINLTNCPEDAYVSSGQDLAIYSG